MRKTKDNEKKKGKMKNETKKTREQVLMNTAAADDGALQGLLSCLRYFYLHLRYETRPWFHSSLPRSRRQYRAARTFVIYLIDYRGLQLRS